MTRRISALQHRQAAARRSEAARPRRAPWRPLLPPRDRRRGQHESEQQAAAVAEKDGGGREVEDQEPQRRPTSAVSNMASGTWFRPTRIATHCRSGNHRDTCGQPVDPIDQVEHWSGRRSRPASAGRRRRRAARSCRRPSNAQSTARSQPQCQLPTSEQPAWARAADRRGRPGCPRQGRAHRPPDRPERAEIGRVASSRPRTTTTSSSAAAADAHTASPPMRGTRLNEPSVRRARLQARARWTRS